MATSKAQLVAGVSGVEQAPSAEKIDTISDDIDTISDDASQIGAPRRSWDTLISEADAAFVAKDFGITSSGPLALPGVSLPIDKLSFAWIRFRRATGEDDPQNMQMHAAAGYRPVPSDMIPSVLSALRARSMDGGVAVEGMVLMYRSLKAERAARQAVTDEADRALAGVEDAYRQRALREGLSLNLPNGSFSNRHKNYVGTADVSMLDEDGDE